jgi:hypothetical protein
MKNYHSIYLLPIVSLFLSASNNYFAATHNSIHNYQLASPKKFDDPTTVYRVRLSFTGSTSLAGNSSDCPIGNGKVVLSGLLEGSEFVGDADDIYYEGILNLEITNMDICSMKRLPNGEDKFCNITVTGSGKVKTTLEIYSDGGNRVRGAYIKIENDSTLHGRFTRNVGGTCDPEQTNEERKMVPNETIASIFNGRDLPMLRTRTLRVGSYTDRGGDGVTVVEVLEKIR